MNRNQIALSMMSQAPQIPGAREMPQMLGQPSTPPIGGLMGGGMQPPTPAAPTPFMQGAQQGAMRMGGAAPGRIPPQQQQLTTPPTPNALGMPDLSAGQQFGAGFGAGPPQPAMPPQPQMPQQPILPDETLY